MLRQTLEPMTQSRRNDGAERELNKSSIRAAVASNSESDTTGGAMADRIVLAWALLRLLLVEIVINVVAKGTSSLIDSTKVQANRAFRSLSHEASTSFLLPKRLMRSTTTKMIWPS